MAKLIVVVGITGNLGGSVGDATKLSHGKYTKLWHFDSKAAVERFVRDDPAMRAASLAAKASFLHVGLYADNWRRAPTELCREAGGYVRVGIADGSRRQPLVWIRRDAGLLVKALVERVPPSARLMACSQMASAREYMAAWAAAAGEELGGDGGVVRLSDVQMRDYIPGDENAKGHFLQCW
ncbi:hypothetical protein B0T26DRAFT_750540 [Lasiosphaeria miniovina]|uniref:Uncharacterized protein n=1 Tax=Lasiosphaeria miniovina TaxID=1954250 RepID=A0AA40AWD1_9PEZI|nr:uncharacterized protein B0T26DRAFT_750540 [Lasiosphaeria miniovina]KAK0723251.1 hypothetical protein B0T26DRAFT_750540 [Lasiosphaeria miniovina]